MNKFLTHLFDTDVNGRCGLEYPFGPRGRAGFAGAGQYSDVANSRRRALPLPANTTERKERQWTESLLVYFWS